ncbi:MAG: hypothetical protein AB8C02_18110 [Halioglobus sp.]
MINRLVITAVWCIALAACSATDTAQVSNANTVVWKQGANVEAFWMQYTDSRGGITWGESMEYPEYAKVKEGDTFLIQLDQGPCLMEFFHSRWRRANDVRRWDDSINAYGGCPHVFE